MALPQGSLPWFLVLFSWSLICRHLETQQLSCKTGKNQTVKELMAKTASRLYPRSIGVVSCGPQRKHQLILVWLTNVGAFWSLNKPDCYSFILVSISHFANLKLPKKSNFVNICCFYKWHILDPKDWAKARWVKQGCENAACILSLFKTLIYCLSWIFALILI